MILSTVIDGYAPIIKLTALTQRDNLCYFIALIMPKEGVFNISDCLW